MMIMSGVPKIKRQGVTAGERKGEFVKPAGAIAPCGETLNKIAAAVADNLLFAGLDKDVTKMVIKEMWMEEFAEGKSCIEQGDTGEKASFFYVVEDGNFGIEVKGNEVTTRGVGTCFGELALMYNAARAATVRAKVQSKVWVIHRQIFRATVKKVSSATYEEFEDFLKSVELLSTLSNSERAKITGALEQKHYPANTVVFEQGADGDGMYIIRKGKVVVHKDGVQVAESGVGDVFGERALLRQEKRAAKVTTTEETTVLILDKVTFDSLLGPLEAIMKTKVQSYDSAAVSAAAAAAEEKKTAGDSDGLTTNLDFKDLTVIGTLGKGSFGHVQLVHDKTGKTYALKGVSKGMIVETGQQGHIMSEKDVMAQLKHPFLINLYQTFKDSDRLYFLLEPVLGGELFSFLRNQTLFTEETSRFYAANVLLAFEYMHSFDIVYRDLKPENLLIDEKGYIKITDFGFAKEISSGRTWTLCGTPDYLAPEIVAGKGHGKGVDWWTLGILIYEMLASYPPFYDRDTMKTYQKIMTGAIEWPEHFSRPATSIIKKLLYRRPTRRLGVVKGGAMLIKNHMWFNSFFASQDADGKSGWDRLLNRELKAPMLPKIADSKDLSNFEDVDEEEEPHVDYEDDGSNWDAKF